MCSTIGIHPLLLPAVYELRVEGWASDDNRPLLVSKDDHQDLRWKLFFCREAGFTLQYFHSYLICLMTNKHSAETWVGAKSSLSGLRELNDHCGPNPIMSASLGRHVTKGCHLLLRSHSSPVVGYFAASS